MRLSMISTGIIQTEVNVICRSRRLRRITLTEVWIILDTMRKPNPRIVLLYIQNNHTKMQAKCGSKKTQKILQNFVIFARFEVVTSQYYDGNDATAAGHWELTGVCWPIRNENEVWMYNNLCSLHAGIVCPRQEIVRSVRTHRRIVPDAF